MQFFCVIRRLTEQFGEDEFAPLLEPEAQRVRTMYAEGTVRNVWSRGDKLGAVLHLEVESEAQVHEFIASLPLAKAEMIDVEMIIPVRGYRGFGPRD